MVRSVCALGLLAAVAQAADEAPVPFPGAKHYAALWERSVFTTKDLPSPDAPTGPIFTDNLGLSGMYDVDGQVVAVLIDRTTSQFSEARIGSENEHGIKIRKVQPGATMDKTRVQLQKGDIAGWVAFGDVTAAAALAEQAPMPGGNPQPGQPPQASPASRRAAAPVPTPSPLLPPLATANAVPMPTPPPPAAAAPHPAAMYNDVPLPPP